MRLNSVYYYCNTSYDNILNISTNSKPYGSKVLLKEPVTIYDKKYNKMSNSELRESFLESPEEIQKLIEQEKFQEAFENHLK